MQSFRLLLLAVFAGLVLCVSAWPAVSAEELERLVEASNGGHLPAKDQLAAVASDLAHRYVSGADPHYNVRGSAQSLSRLAEADQERYGRVPTRSQLIALQHTLARHGNHRPASSSEVVEDTSSDYSTTLSSPAKTLARLAESEMHTASHLPSMNDLARLMQAPQHTHAHTHRVRMAHARHRSVKKNVKSVHLEARKRVSSKRLARLAEMQLPVLGPPTAAELARLQKDMSMRAVNADAQAVLDVAKIQKRAAQPVKMSQPHAAQQLVQEDMSGDDDGLEGEVTHDQFNALYDHHTGPDSPQALPSTSAERTLTALQRTRLNLKATQAELAMVQAQADKQEKEQIKFKTELSQLQKKNKAVPKTSLCGGNPCAGGTASFVLKIDKLMKVVKGEISADKAKQAAVAKKNVAGGGAKAVELTPLCDCGGTPCPCTGANIARAVKTQSSKRLQHALSLVKKDEKKIKSLEKFQKKALHKLASLTRSVDKLKADCPDGDCSKGRRGPPGPRGRRGRQGRPGRPGQSLPGAPGLNGAPGATGPRGPAGPRGRRGRSGSNGLPGARGPQGPVGHTGGQGPPGPPGPRGPQGQAGAMGPAGHDGRNGASGPPGSPGPPGPQGNEGRQGRPGPRGDEGRRGPPGPPPCHPTRGCSQE